MPNLDEKLKQRAPQRWALATAFLLLCGPLALIVSRISRDAIFPTEDQRFDVTQLWVSPAADLCPAAAGNQTPAAIEACLSRQSLNDAGRSTQLQAIKLPSVFDTPINTHPRFFDLIKDQGAQRAVNAMSEQKVVAVGFKVPSRYFREDRFGSAPDVLVLAGAPDARICYLGHCPHYTDHNAFIALQFPLIVDSEAKLPELVDVWLLFLSDGALSGPNLDHGIFVTNANNMRAATMVHKPFILSIWIIEAALLLGIVLMALLYAALWSEYIDFAAFAMLALFKFLHIVIFWLFSIFYLSEPTFHGFNSSYVLKSVNYMLYAEVAIATICLAIATLRPHPPTFWLRWVLAGLVTGVLYGYIGLNLRDHTAHLVTGVIPSIVQAFVPSLIAIVGGIRLRRNMTQGQIIRSAAWHSANRRYREQLTMGLCLFIAGLPTLAGNLQFLVGEHTYNLNGFTGLTLFPTFAALLYSAGGKFRSRAEAYRLDVVSMTKKAAVGEMVQMLAHDVRKPFSLLRMGLELLAHVGSLQDLQRVLDRLVPQVSTSMKQVTAMLEDVMAVSSEPTIHKELIAVDMIILQCLRDVFITQPESEVEFIYHFNSTAAVELDSLKMLRVCTNIVENAVQATKGRCRITFTTGDSHEGGRDWLVLTINNSGSFIPTSRCEQVFDAFFTHGKATGTGLGLAVSRRFVELHGGAIICRSDAIAGTAFILKFPTCPQPAEQPTALAAKALPKHSRELNDPIGQVKHTVSSSLAVEFTAAEQHEIIVIAANISRIGRPLRVLLLDDEPIYTEALCLLLDAIVAPNQTPLDIQVTIVRHSKTALEAFQTTAFDLAVFDVDLGHDAIDGVTLMTQVKDARQVRTACIHSNRILPVDLKHAAESGADRVLPKPMRRSHMLELLSLAASAAQSSPQLKPVAPHGPELVVVIDDDIFIRECWEDLLGPERALTFAGPEEVLSWLSGPAVALDGVLCFVTDFYLQAELDGVQLAAKIRALTDKPILLATDAIIALEPEGPIAAVIGKTPVDHLALQRILKSGPDAIGAA